MKWRTCVKVSCKRFFLMRATLLGGAGILILTLASVFLPSNQLSYWGLPLFILGIGLVAWGMIPYRRLVRLESHPDEIVLEDNVRLIYHRQGKKVGLIPLSLIDRILYVSTQRDEGISLQLHRKLPNNEKVIVYQQKQLQFLDGNIFLPFFSERTYKELVEHINSI